MSISAPCQLDCLRYMLPGRVQQSLFKRIASEHDWSIPNVRWSISEANCGRVHQNFHEILCKTFSTSVFYQRNFQQCMLPVRVQQSFFGRIASKHDWTSPINDWRSVLELNVGRVHQTFLGIICSTLSTSAHCQLDCLQYMLPACVQLSCGCVFFWNSSCARWGFSYNENETKT